MTIFKGNVGLFVGASVTEATGAAVSATGISVGADTGVSVGAATGMSVGVETGAPVDRETGASVGASVEIPILTKMSGFRESWTQPEAVKRGRIEEKWVE